MRRILKRLQIPLPHETGFNVADNPYTESEFLKICEDYRAPNDPMKYQDEKFYWTYQHGIRWPNDYIGPDQITRWIIEKSVGFTDVGLLRISESVRAYAYLIISSQASARSSIIGNTASALTAQSAFLNNFENVVNPRVDIRDDIKCYQDTFSYAFSLGKNEKVNAGLAKSEEETMTKQTTTVHKVVTKAPQPPAPTEKAIITHEDEKIAFILLLTGGLCKI